MAPYARNGSSAAEYFYYRSEYRDQAWDPGDNNVPSADLWYDRKMYGKIDFKYNSIFLSESRLKSLGTHFGKNLYAINFVVNAFEDFKKYINKKALLGQTAPGTLYAKLTPHRAWSKKYSAISEYDVMMKSLYLQFANSISHSMDKKIRNFDDFVKFFFFFYRDNLATSHIPLTLTGFINSSILSPLSSGLMIEVAREKYDDDYKKDSLFYNNTMFPLIRDAAIRFGFVLDENAPWRLVADLSSESMKKYMSEYNVTYENVFDSNYYKSKYIDIQLLHTYIVDFYNTYVNAKPRVGLGQYCVKKGVTLQKMIKRKPMKIKADAAADIYRDKKKYGFTYWANLYMKTRMIEASSDISPQHYSIYQKNVQKMHGKLDIADVITYIDTKIKTTSAIYPWVETKERLSGIELKLAREQMAEQTTVNIDMSSLSPVEVDASGY